LLLLSPFFYCEYPRGELHWEEQNMTSKTIAEVFKLHVAHLMSLPGVLGTSQGLHDGKPCIKVYVREKTPELAQEIPDALDGYKVVVEETGEFQALPENDAYR
jgi:hypothetical protein